jgi:hypothetical protein
MLLLILICLMHALAAPIASGAEEATPKDSQAIYVRGRELLDSGKTEEGLALFRQAGSNGLLRAQASLAEMLLGRTNSLTRKEGLGWALLAARESDPKMQNRLISELRAGDPP